MKLSLNYKLMFCKLSGSLHKKIRTVKIWLILVFTLFMNVIYSNGQGIDRLSFLNPIITNGADESLVQIIESAVIIPGDTHEDLWVHPELVTIPGKPIVIEFRARTTDRYGKDQHTEWHYFRTDDFFQTLHSINEPDTTAWKRLRLSRNRLNVDKDNQLKVPEKLGHTFASAYYFLDGDTILQAFTTQNEGRYYSKSMIALAVGNGQFVPLHISNSWTNNTGRGLYEPHIAEYRGKFYMTGRAEDGRGYLMVSHDRGWSWDEPVPWKWDNGEIISMDQTMTKLLAHSDGLVLVYTRIRDDNEKTFRHRAPLHIADLDPETLTLKRTTERIIVPNKGMCVGTFWVWPINQQESYVVTAEWPRDGRKTNGDIWLAKVKWRTPNLIMTKDGVECAALK
jgi:hypothetical protein